MARTRIQTIRSSVSGARPSGREPGELYSNWPDKQLGVVDAARQPIDLIPIRFHSTTGAYAAGDMVKYQQKLYQARQAIVPGNFDPTLWDEIATGRANVSVGDNPTVLAPGQGELWFESDTGDLFVYYIDQSGVPGQWVQVNKVIYSTTWREMTQASYDALAVKDPNILYVIIG